MMKEIGERIYYSFPAQLLINNFKKNQIILLVWLFLFGFVSMDFGRRFGIPYLFLDPEYLNQVDFKSLLIMGTAFGAFSMAFHITNYILDSSRFSFLGTLSRPFGKFLLNNSIIPVAFLIVYLFSFIRFQTRSGLESGPEIFEEAIGFIIGYIGVHIIFYLYFRYTNKDIFKIIATNVNTTLKKSTISRVHVMQQYKSRKKKNRVDSYFDLPFKFVKVDMDTYYEKQHILKVFDQNHLNAAFIQLMGFLTILILGLFKDNEYFQIPAGASALILFSLFVSITGFLSFWMRGWAISGVVLLLITINFLSTKKIFDLQYKVFGINYGAPMAEYSPERIDKLASHENFRKDYDSTIVILENWKKKFPAGTKPKMIFVCTSGGGQRAAAWALRTLQVSDSLTGGNVMKHTMLITGASGGLIGASFFRELVLQRQQAQISSPYSDKYFEQLTKDVLNPITFSLVVNDIFFRSQTFKYGGYEYAKDRGYAFEKIVCRNTDQAFPKRVMDYKSYEHNAQIPMLIISPTVINDGRKLYISPQNISYMCRSENSFEHLTNQKVKGIEFNRFFKDQDAKNLGYMSALRMSATFPYITPNVILPSEPSMEIMDAGLSDNFGLSDASRFLYVFRDWVSKNTSGVIFISIRDSQKNEPIEKREGQSLSSKVFVPIGSLYNNWDLLQDITNDNIIDYTQGWYNGPVDAIDFEYLPKPKNWNLLKDKKLDQATIDQLVKAERASLSWHLTTREKESLKRSVFEPNNKAALNKLQQLLH